MGTTPKYKPYFTINMFEAADEVVSHLCEVVDEIVESKDDLAYLTDHALWALAHHVRFARLVRAELTRLYAITGEQDRPNSANEPTDKTEVEFEM